MSFAIWQRTIVDDEGNVLAGASIEVRQELAGGVLAALFGDRDGNTNKGNPFTADAEGFASFYVVGGAYQITASLGGFSRTWRHVAIGTAAETDALEIPVPTPAQWTFDSSIVMADPGSQEFRLNNADPTLATSIAISETQFTADGAGTDAAAWLAIWDDAGETTIRGVIEIFDSSNPTTLFHRYRVTGSLVDNGTWDQVTLIWLSGEGTFVEGDEYDVVFWPAGPSGASGGSLFGPNNTLALSATSTNLTAVESGFLVTNSGSNRIVNLPAASSGLNFAFHTTGGTLTVNTIGSEIITFEDDSTAASVTLTAGQRFIVVCDGTNWFAFASTMRTLNLKQGIHTLSVPSAAMYTPSTAGATAATTELVASAPINALRTLAFDPGTEEAAFFMIPMPKSWDGGTFAAEFLWTATSGAGDVVWGIEARVFSEGDALEAAFGSQQTVTDTLTTAGDLHVSADTSAITAAGTPADDSVLICRVSREAGNAADTLTVDALLLGLRLFITLDDENDA